MMEEVNMVTNQRSGLERWIYFNVDHGDRIIQNHGVEGMEGVWRQAA